MLVNACTCSLNNEPNQEADRDPKGLSERDSFLCEQSQYHKTAAKVIPASMKLTIYLCPNSRLVNFKYLERYSTFLSPFIFGSSCKQRVNIRGKVAVGKNMKLTMLLHQFSCVSFMLSQERNQNPLLCILQTIISTIYIK